MIVVMMSINSTHMMRIDVMMRLSQTGSSVERGDEKLEKRGEKCQPSQANFKSTDLCQFKRSSDDSLHVPLGHQTLSFCITTTIAAYLFDSSV